MRKGKQQKQGRVLHEWHRLKRSYVQHNSGLNVSISSLPKGKSELLYPLKKQKYIYLKKKLYAKAAQPWPCPAFSLLPSNFQPKKKKNPFNFLISCLTGINAQIIVTVEHEDTVLPC